MRAWSSSVASSKDRRDSATLSCCNEDEDWGLNESVGRPVDLCLLSMSAVLSAMTKTSSPMRLRGMVMMCDGCCG